MKSRHGRVWALCGTVFVVLLLMTVICAGPCAAANEYWNAGDGLRSVDANWSPTGVPGAGDNASLTSSDIADRTITYDYNYASTNALGSLTVCSFGTGTMTLSQGGNTLKNV
jgi:hypothetical protein